MKTYKKKLSVMMRRNFQWPLSVIPLDSWMKMIKDQTQKSRIIAGVLIMQLLVVLSIIPVHAQTQNALSLYEKGLSYSSRGEFREAVHYFRKSLEKNPDYISAHHAAAMAYFSLGDSSRSIEHYKKVISLDNENLSAHSGIALVYTRINQFPLALKNLEFVRNKDPGNIDNNHAFGVYYYHLGHYSLARSFFQKTIRLSPRHIQSLLGLARVQLIRGRYDNSRMLLDKASAIDADHFEIHLLKGELYLKKAVSANDLDNREIFFKKSKNEFLLAEKLLPEDFNVQLHLILHDLHSNDFQSAYARSIALANKKHATNKILYLNAVLAANTGETTRAIDALKRALYRDPADSIVRYKLESLMLDKGAGFTANKNRLSNYHQKRAEVYYKTRKYHLFRIHLKRALELNPSCTICLNMILDFSRKTSDGNSYIKILRQLQRKDASNPRLKFRLERALKKNKSGLAYRKNLFNKLERPTGATYKRTPILIYIFDPDIETGLNYHVDVSAVLANALTKNLHSPGNAQSVSFGFRKSLEKRMNARGDEDARIGLYFPYQPEHIRQIEILENQNSLKIDYLVTGFVQSNNKEIEYKATLIEKQTATVIKRASFKKNGRDAIMELVSELSNWIRKVLPLQGSVINKQDGDIYLNIGQVDGVELNDLFYVHRFGENKGKIQILEIDGYVSRARMIQGKMDHVDAHDTVVKIKNPAKKPG